MNPEILRFYQNKGYQYVGPLDAAKNRPTPREKHLWKRSQNGGITFYYLWEDLPANNTTRFSRVMLYSNNVISHYGVELYIEAMYFSEVPVATIFAREEYGGKADDIMLDDTTPLFLEEAGQLMEYAEGEALGHLWHGSTGTEKFDPAAWPKLSVLLEAREKMFPERDNWLDWNAETLFLHTVELSTEPPDELAHRELPIDEKRQLYIDQNRGLWICGLDDGDADVHRVDKTRAVRFDSKGFSVPIIKHYSDEPDYGVLEPLPAGNLHKYWQYEIEVDPETKLLFELLKRARIKPA